MSVDIFGRIEWGPTQAKALACPKKAVLVQGGFGSGKSLLFQGWMHRMGFDNPRSNLLILRKTYEMVIDAVVQDLEQNYNSPDRKKWPTELLYGGSWDRAYSNNDRRPYLKLVNGTVLHFRGVVHEGKEDPTKFGSMPFAGVGIEEMSDFGLPKTFNYLDGRCRQRTTEDGYNQLFLVGNPPESNHWSQYEFVELPRQKKSVATQRERIILPTRENVKHLPAGYEKDLRDTYTAMWVKRYLDGETGLLEDGMPVLKGCYTPETDSGSPWHVAEGRIETNEKYPIIRGWDFGVAYAACVFAQYIPEPHPVLNILHEITHRQTNALEFGGPVRAISSLLFPKHEFIDRGDPAGKARSIATGDTAFKVLAKEHGINVVQAPTNDAGKRIAALTEAFSRVGYGGRPFIRISNGVGTQFLRDGLMAGWSYQQNSEGYIGQMEPRKNEYSHPCDALGYIVCSLLGISHFVKNRGTKKISTNSTRAVSSQAWMAQ